MNNAMLIKLFFLISLPLLLTACASRYTVTTNLDNESFTHYFSPAKVIIYKDEKSMLTDSREKKQQKFRYLGSVEADDCQAKPHHQAPDEINARTQARRQAYKLGANAIVFSGCALIENNKADKQCVATTVCYAKAYHVTANE